MDWFDQPIHFYSDAWLQKIYHIMVSLVLIKSLSLNSFTVDLECIVGVAYQSWIVTTKQNRCTHLHCSQYCRYENKA